MKGKRILLVIIIVMLALGTLLVACGSPEPADPDAALAVVAAENETKYTRADLEALGQATAEADGNTYVGVPLADLLRDAGLDPAQLETVTAVASDGFSATYDAEMIQSAGTLVAYALADGALANDEQPFRMVLPGQPGRLNVRMLARIEAAP